MAKKEKVNLAELAENVDGNKEVILAELSAMKSAKLIDTLVQMPQLALLASDNLLLTEKDMQKLLCKIYWLDNKETVAKLLKVTEFKPNVKATK